MLPIDAVIFDYHSTLVDGGDAAAWLEDAWTHDGRAGDPKTGLGETRYAEAISVLDDIWSHSRAIDPDSSRDLDPTTHRRVYDATLEPFEPFDSALTDALYERMTERWVAYEDTLTTLRDLRQLGVKIAILSNVGMDVRGAMEREGLSELADALVLSYEFGAVKPSPEIFQHAVSALGAEASRTLMVGDSWRDDGGAAGIGIRTLLLPRTRTPAHGLSLVTALVHASRS